MSEETGDDHKKHSARHSGRKASKKAKKGENSEESAAQKNPKAFTFHSAVRAAKAIHR